MLLPNSVMNWWGMVDRSATNRLETDLMPQEWDVPPRGGGPSRGDEVESWLIRWRDSAKATFIPATTLDQMLDEYRFAADGGISLSSLDTPPDMGYRAEQL